MKRGILLLVAVCLIIPIASAEIMLSQPKSVYNINDNIDVSATIKATQASDGFLKLTLACPWNSNDFYLSPLTLASGSEEKIAKKLVLSPSFLQGMQGQCTIKASYASDSASTQAFEITNRIDLALSLPGSVKAGDSIIVKGDAIKANGQNVEGFFEMTVENTDIKITRQVTQGKFEANLSFPENTKSGNYNIKILVYEKSGDDMTNYAEKSSLISIRQNPSKIEIIIDRQAITPGASIEFKPVIYDKADTEVPGDVNIEVRDPLDNLYYNKLLGTGEETVLNFSGDASSGYWSIIASSLGIKTKRLFFMEELEKASFEIVNNTLVITNVGNVPYKKAVQIAIGNEVEVKELSLEIGQSKRFRLLAPDGDYRVSVTDGSETLTREGIGLTGNAIGIADIGNSISMFYKYPIVWLFLIVIFGMFLVIMVQRIGKKSFYGIRSAKTSSIPVKSEKPKEAKQDFMPIPQNVREAEHSLVLQGNKEDAGVLVLKIKSQVADKFSAEAVEKAIASISSSKGSIYKQPGMIVGIFSPSVTKTFKNDIAAIKVASAISSHLNEYNKKSMQKINYGIGINSGELVAKVEQGKLKFTPLGNVINFARRAAETADNSVLVTGNTNRKVQPEVKTLKQGEYYSISKIVDRESNSSFIQSFKERQGFS